MDKISALKKLKGYLEEGIITEEEFIRQKNLVLGGKPKQETTDTPIPIPQPIDNTPVTEPEGLPKESSPVDETPAPTIIPSIEIVEDSEEQVINWIEGGPTTASSASEEDTDVKKEKYKTSKTLLLLGVNCHRKVNSFANES